MFFLVVAVLLVRLALILTVPVPVSVDLAEAFWGWNLRSIGLFGWFETVGMVYLGYKWLKKSKWMALILAVNPWTTALTMHHPREALLVIGFGIILAYPKKVALALGVGIILVTVWWGKSYWIKLSENNLYKDLKPAKLAEEVDFIQKVNFLATGKTYILPAALRKVAYNKPALAIEKTLARMVSLVDLEQWSAPMAAWVLTGMSGIPPKGVTALFYFWEIGLVLWWVVRVGTLRKRNILLFVLAILPALIFEKKFFLTTGIGLLLMIAAMAAKGLALVERKWVKWGVVALYLVGMGYTLQYLYLRQDNYRYSDAKLYYEAARIINSYPSEKYVVTDRFGPMEIMLTWYGVPLERVEVRAFSLNQESDTETLYIGLPKEMAGINEEKIVTKIEADDQLVYGFGSGLWAGKL